jgi:hypothetical protein
MSSSVEREMRGSSVECERSVEVARSASPRLGARALVVLVSALGLFASGCYDSYLCGEPESCNYDDDDCDRRIDEEFIDEDGVYATLEHCGGCNVACPSVFPTAAETACEIDAAAGTARCVIVACPEGWHRADDGSCAPDLPVLCLPCTEDADCTLRDPGARCVELDGDARHCLPPCGEGPCAPGFVCEGAVCTPTTGSCGCTEETIGVELACLFERDEDFSCAAVQRCTEAGLGACEPVLEETCNEVDDDCDEQVDELFRDDEGRYVDRLHCGACNVPCVEPGPNMIATCEPRAGLATECVVECLEGFVDVDGILANGCECERAGGDGPPPAIGGDTDCDGVPDETDDYVYVTTTGSDTNPGTLERPMRSIPAALQRARDERKDVLVARGIYDGRVELVGGVSIFGGYRPDFRDRDLELFPVVIEHTTGEPGDPALVCRNVSAATRVDGVTVRGTDATRAGRGSTAVYLDGCGPAVQLSQIVVLAGRGADGVRGASASDRLAMMGASLPDLDGVPGNTGATGNDGTFCPRTPGGRGGAHVCPDGVDVSGGDGGATECSPVVCTNGRPCGNSGCTDFTSGGVCDFDAVLRVAVPNPAAGIGRGPSPGAAGPLTYDAPTNRGVCNFCDDNPTLERNGGRGGDGADGVDGMGGLGCMAGPLFDASSGRLGGAAGTDGTPGTHGSGGGGGTAGAGYAVIGGTSGGCSDRSGGSGGGGGGGGCGAPAAAAGTGGGTSTAIVVRLTNASGPVLTDVRVVTASGGAGGPGGQGAAGGGPGAGANGGGSRFWCARTGGRGGEGGRGGAGGGGGGGCGGGSHGVVVVRGLGDPAGYVGALGVTIDATGVPGRGGAGGFAPNATGGAGTNGSSQRVLVL